MFRIRPVQEDDFHALEVLINHAEIGLTSLPKNKTRILEMVKKSSQSFAADVEYPFYLFILENMITKELVGTAGIYWKTPHIERFILKKLLLPSRFPEAPLHVSLLMRKNEEDKSSEICALFLVNKARQEGLGKLLSFSRFHFIAAHLEQFPETILADLRGVIGPLHECPFWDSIGRHFYPVEFNQLMKLRDEDENVILDLMPTYPIYFELLPESAKQVLGQTHLHSKAALKMLIKQGFKLSQEFDLYDGGPCVRANIKEIKTVNESKTALIISMKSKLDLKPLLISNEKRNFLACFGKFNPETGTIDTETARALEVSPGDIIRYSP